MWNLKAAAVFIAAAKLTVCAELGVLDGGPLSQALSQAAAKGVHLRLLLDPTERSTRLEGRALALPPQGLSPSAAVTVELRWAPSAGARQRDLLRDASALMRWTPGQAPWQDDKAAAAYGQDFERRWSRAAAALPEAQALEDDLKALPDPRVNDPRIIRRRDASGE